MKLGSYIWGVKDLFNYNVDYNRSESGVIIPHYVNIASEGGDTTQWIGFAIAALFVFFVVYLFENKDKYL